MSAAIVDRTFASEPSGLLPPVTKDNAPFWSSLQQGILSLQRCRDCVAFRFPIAPVCPRCGGIAFAWEPVSGRGHVFSSVRYPRSYLAEFEPLVPYVVACVALLEGPRMFGLLRERHAIPAIGSPVKLEVERWPDGRCVPAFRCTVGAEE